VNIPKQRKGPKGIISFGLTILKIKRTLDISPPVTNPRNMDITVYLNPRKTPVAPISLISPPPIGPISAIKNKNPKPAKNPKPMDLKLIKLKNIFKNIPDNNKIKFNESGIILLS
jgi:hypothetical protein